MIRHPLFARSKSLYTRCKNHLALRNLFAAFFLHQLLFLRYKNLIEI